MVAVLLADGFETIEALAPVDLLRRAGIELLLAGVGKTEIISSHGISVKADLTVEELRAGDIEMLVLPGGGVGVDNLWESQSVRRLVLDCAGLGKQIAAICAAPAILARLGLLDGLRAVCYPSFAPELIEKGAKIQPDERVVTDRNITTAQAAGSSIDFGLRLVSLLRGWEASEKIRKAIYYPELSPALT